ncbi:alpha-(1,3)-fucosyltransferase C [Patella vulgata]|uniref:alpha-(1,3)-fucosyltransferase C n=1 Tax=Patella vulgata TaxID=6465 RepID=UPI0021809B8D|nr:alpha-(1,3)-fucosyltransferase C [Patella vulgata]
MIQRLLRYPRLLLTVIVPLSLVIIIFMYNNVLLGTLNVPFPQIKVGFYGSNGFKSQVKYVSSQPDTDKKRLILWLNPPNYIRLSSTYNPKQNCPELNCEYTWDPSNFNLSDIVIVDSFKLPRRPPQKLPYQKWMFYMQEAPTTGQVSPIWRDKFDLTATYKRDSDVPTPYGIIRPRADKYVHQNQMNYTFNFNAKKRAAVWIVSHCRTSSKREQIVSMLQHFFPVDILGGCGKRVCSRHNDKKCLRKVIEKYMFYISFENSLCRDYVTEKFFRYYSYDTIQIVRGGINYSEIAPAGTFIDYSDFKSVNKLANHLNTLADDEQKYSAYLKRKAGYQSLYELYQYHASFGYYTHPHYLQQPLCDICKLTLNTSQTSKYPDITKWFSTDQCRKPTDII